MKQAFKIYIIVGFAAISSFLNAQQVALTSQYDLISSIQNPAYNGVGGNLRVDGLSRVQWANFPGTPNYTALAFQTPVSKDFAVGAQFQSLRVGDFKFTSPLSMGAYTVDLAYHTQIAKNVNIATGIRAGMFNFNMNIAQLVADVPDDIAIAGNNYSFKSPLIGGGILIYGKNYFVGGSLPQYAIISDRIVNNVNLSYNAKSFYLLTAGYVQPVYNSIALKATVQARNYEGLPWQFDGNIYLMFDDDLNLGYGYRSTGSHAGMLRVKINDFFHVVYAYEMGKVYDQETSFNSQEFGLRYQINYSKQKVKVSPRYY